MKALDQKAFAREIKGVAGDLAGVEILCGIPSYNSSRTVANVVRAVEAGLRRFYPEHSAAIVLSDGSSEDGTVEEALEASTKPDEDLLLIPSKSPLPRKVALVYSGLPGKGSAFRAIFEIAKQSRAKACAVFDSDLRSISPVWVDNLVGPVLEQGSDFVAPLYARHKYDGTITNSIAYPATAALYGFGLRQPIGGEFGFSGRLAAHWAKQDVWGTDVARFGIDIWMTTVAIVEGFSVCQTQLGAKVHDAKDPGADLAPMFRQVVGSLFALAGRYADRWLNVDRIQPVPTFGFRAATAPEEIRVKTGRLTWRFIEGFMRYEELWTDVLSRETFRAVTRATQEAADRTEGFVLPAELWAHIVFDYLVAYNQQVVDVATLIDSLIPLYFARTATFIQEAAHDDHDAAEIRIQHYADLFLERKDYLVRQWKELGVRRSLGEQRITPEGVERVEDGENVLGQQTA